MGKGGYYVAGPPLLNERCTSLLRPPVSEITYTVSSGTINSTIPYYTININVAKIGLRNRCEKMKTMFVGEPSSTPISVGLNLLQTVENFQYLGSYITNQSDIEVNIRARLGKAALVFQRLNRIWSSHSINSTIKFRLYTSIVLSTALHARETKSMASIRNTLDVFHRQCIPKILGLSWQDRVTNEELMRRYGMQALSEIVQTRRLSLAGHVLRLPDVRPARVAMTWIADSGGRTSGRPKKTWRTSFKEDLHGTNLTWHGARRTANDRHPWRNLVVQCPVRDRRNYV